MKRLLQRTLAAVGVALLAAWSGGASADLITARFDGTVSGFMPGFLDLNAVAYDNDHPVGTAVHWDITFDNSFIGLPWYDPAVLTTHPVTGSLQVGADTYNWTDMFFFSLTLGGPNNTPSEYRPQVNGTGPLTSDGASLFGMFWSFAPDMSLVYPGMIGYAYQNGIGTSYGYLETAGNYSVGPANRVPEPATALLALPGLLLLMRKRRRAVHGAQA